MRQQIFRNGRRARGRPLPEDQSRAAASAGDVAGKTRKILRRTHRLALLAGACLAAPGLAAAQVAPSQPPPFQRIDANGVDLGTGTFNLVSNDVLIGAGAQALTLARGYQAGWQPYFQTSGMTTSGATYTVTLDGGSEAFTLAGSVYTSNQAAGGALSYNASTGHYTYTRRDGAVATYGGIPGLNGWANTAIIAVTYASGLSKTYTYVTQSVYLGSSGGQPLYAYFSRVQGITTNNGYELKYIYSTDTLASTAGLPQWMSVASVTAINNTVAYCDPAATSCPGLTGWPVASYGYTGSLMTSFTDPLNRTTTYGYDSSNRLSGITTPAGATTTITYNASSQVASVTRGSGTWTYGYSTSGSIETTTITDPNTNVRTVAMNSSTNVITDTNALSQTTTYQYDANLRLTQAKLPEGDYVQYTLDGSGNPTTTTLSPKPGSGLTSFNTTATFPTTCTPTTCNQPTATVDGDGKETDYTYDTYGSLLTVTAPAGASGVRPQTRYTYVATKAYYYTAAGVMGYSPSPIDILTATSSCQAGASCSGTADEVKSTITYPTGTTPSNLLPSSATGQAGDGSVSATSAQTYDSIGNALTITAPAAGPTGSSRTTYYTFDTDREVVGAVAPNPSETGLANLAEKITYNSDGHVTLAEEGTMPSQSDTNWGDFISKKQVATSYDAYLRPAQTAVTAGGTTLKVSQLSYDVANRPTCAAVRTNAGAFGALPASACTLQPPGSSGPDQVAHVTYDALNRPSVVTTGYGTSAAANYESFAYTPDGLVQTVTDANSNVTTSAYDGFNRVGKVTFPGGTYESYGYDNNGNLTLRQLRSGETLSFTYDALNRVTLKHYSSNAVNQDVYLGYDLLNRALYARFGSATGLGVANTYDALGRVKTTTDSNGRALQYSYDAAGDRTQLTYADSGANALAVQYAYDNLQRVTSITENGSYVLAGFGYDSLGRRTALSRGSGGSLAATGYAYDGLDRLSQLSQTFANSANNLTLGLSRSPSDQLASKSVSNAAYTYAPPAGSTTYSANGLNQYATVSGTSYSYDGRGNLTSDGTRSFSYDLDNRLLTASAPTPVSLTYDPLGRLQTSTAAGVTTNFLYDGDALVAEYDSSGSILRRYAPGPGQDEPAVWYEGAGTSGRRWLHADDTGSIVAWSDSTANPQAIYGYGPYGEQATWSGSRYRYTGQLMIPEAHLYNYKARVYDPGLGRFLQTDPVGYASDMNAYAYAGSDPINGSDASGLGATWYSGNGGLVATTYITLDNSTPECCSAPADGDTVATSYPGHGGASYAPATPQSIASSVPLALAIGEVVVTGKKSSPTTTLDPRITVVCCGTVTIDIKPVGGFPAGKIVIPFPWPVVQNVPDPPPTKIPVEKPDPLKGIKAGTGSPTPPPFEPPTSPLWKLIANVLGYLHFGPR